MTRLPSTTTPAQALGKGEHVARRFDLDWLRVLGQLGMPLIFVVSAASSYYALGTRSAGSFLKERCCA